ncbi:MAG: hypothetical protein V1824_03780 [archaeon]
MKKTNSIKYIDRNQLYVFHKEPSQQIDVLQNKNENGHSNGYHPINIISSPKFNLNITDEEQVKLSKLRNLFTHNIHPRLNNLYHQDYRLIGIFNQSINKYIIELKNLSSCKLYIENPDKIKLIKDPTKRHFIKLLNSHIENCKTLLECLNSFLIICDANARGAFEGGDPELIKQETAKIIYSIGNGNNHNESIQHLLLGFHNELRAEATLLTQIDRIQFKSQLKFDIYREEFDNLICGIMPTKKN